MTPRRLLLLLSLPLCLAAQAATYQWVDDAGEAVYSQSPPPDGREFRVIGAPPPPAESPEAARRRLAELQQRLADRQEDRELQHTESQKAAAEAATQAANCRTAQRNLRVLQQRSRQLIRDKEGNYQRYTQQEKAQKVAEYQKIIDRDCVGR